MIKVNQILRSTFVEITQFSCTVAFVIALLCQVAIAQTSVTDGNTPLGLAPGGPAGSYELSNLEQINFFNGNLSFNLPILHVGGRGSAGYTMQISQNVRKWRVGHQIWQTCGQNGCTVTGHTYYPTENWWAGLQPGYSPGVIVGRRSGENPFHPAGCPIGSDMNFSALTRITFTTTDGTEYELRDQRLGGQPQNWVSGCGTQGAFRGRVFVSGDGSAVTFISDTDIYDSLETYLQTFYPSGYILFKDGTRYRLDSGTVSWIRDRNGNQVMFAGGSQLTTITDSIGRSITISYGNPDVITYKGFSGATRTIQISRASLSTVLRPCRPDPGYQCFSPQTYKQLFPLLDGSNYSTFNPSVPSAITLPDGRQYRLYYNSYGELARVDLPTGGTIEYDYASGYAGESSGVISGTVPLDPYFEKAIYRRVVEKRVYPDGNTLEGKVTFSVDSNPTVVDYLKPGGDLLSREKHYFFGSPTSSFWTGANSYPVFTDGREYKTQFLNSNGTTVLRETNSTWQQGCAVSQWSSQVPNNPRMADTTSTLEPSGANQVSKQTYSYDCYNNRTDTYEYDFGTGSPAANYTRRTHTDYLTINTISGASYDTLNPNSTNPDINATYHLRSLPKQVSIYDAGNIERARTTYEYDNYAVDAHHASLTPRTNISGLCTVISSPTVCDNLSASNYVSRGNITGISRFLLTNGAVTGSIAAFSQYDIAGNLVKAIDGGDFITSLFYDDCFGAPNGEARTNSAPGELGGQSTFAFVTKVTNATNQSSFGQFDYYLARPVDGEDVNGVTASGFYNDLLDRPKQVRRAVGTSLENQTTFDYDDVSRVITTTSDLNANNDNALVSKTLYDGLGRTTETRQYEGGTNYTAAQTQYDALGRAFKVSNPFRPWQSEVAIWTTTVFDALGRVLTVTTPDSAVVTTSYSGNTVTVADQAAKTRKSVTDGLGRLKQVYEDPTGLNYLTSCAYDVLDDLTTVTQGVQTRSFVYDSLKRLSSATNPESGTISYQYDSNGNLVVKTDARGASSHYSYDALNRSLRRWYNGSSLTTATVNNSPALPSGVGVSDEASYFYDAQTLPTGAPSFARGYSTGRLVAMTYGAGSSAGDYYGYDAAGRAPLKIQQTGGINFQTSAIYNVAGARTGETYPSGRTVSYSYDTTGRASSFTGNLGDGVARNYATEIIYSPLGGMTKEKFGTDTALYNKLFYNSRGQLSEIREGTSYTGPTDTGWERGAIINYYGDCWGMCGGSNSTTPMTDNNGNLKKQEVFVPGSNSWLQQYDYDNLNRLQRVHEYTGNTSLDWQQEYVYDRYGNRRIEQDVTKTYGAGVNKKDFTANVDNNNRLGVPNGQTGAMSYDAAGNLTTDTYSGAAVSRAYDAENRMTTETQANNFVAGVYTYNADGQRVRRKVSGVETWQVYGFDGELLAEYAAANPAVSSPQKEYGYRNGQLLITTEAASQASTQNVSWTNAVGVSAAVNNLTKTAAAGWGNAGAASTQAITSGDGYVETTASETSTARLVGLSHVDADQNYTSVDFGIDMDTGGVIYVFEAGNNRGTFGTYATGDKLRVAVEGGVVKYKKNGTVIYTSTVAPTYPLSVDTSLYTNGSTLTNVVVSGNLSNTQSVSWTNAVGASVNGSSLSKTAATAWGNAGAASTQAITSGDGYVEATASETATARLVGLSHVDADQNYTSVDFGIDLDTGGVIYIFESGNNRGTFGTYATGDKLRVAVEGGVVKYKKNGAVFYSSTVAPTYPLLVDTSLYTNGGTLTNVVISTNPGGGSTSVNINWLVTDQLGTPRMIFDKTGALANVKRHDYLPFGEELYAGQGLRSTTLGYSAADGVRQKFTRKERDNETGLDFFEARYYASMQGRFTSVDALLSSGIPGEPQSWNRYSYTINNPLKFIDPTGLIWVYLDSADSKTRTFRWYDNPNDVPKGWTEYTAPYYDGADGRYYLNPKGPAGWFDFGSDQGNGGQGLFTINTDPYVRNGWAKGPTPEQYAAYMRSGAVEDASWDIVMLLVPGKITKEGIEAGLTAKAAREALEAIPTAANPRLQRTIDALFQTTDRLPGGTAGAIRHELETGELVGGRSHLIKGSDRIRNLERIMRTEKLSPADRATAQRLIHDLQDALKGK